MDHRAAAQQLLAGITQAGGARADGLPRNFFARLMFLRLSETFSPNVPLFVQKVAFSCSSLLMRLTGVEKRFSVYFD
jgi:hypothetical protein